jgi:secondary thiamine-phosphate synthase enzyme
MLIQRPKKWQKRINRPGTDSPWPKVMLMAVSRGTFDLKTSAKDEIVDVTAKVQEIVSSSKIMNGLACVFVAGSTAAITTVEHEPGLVADLRDAMDRLYPRDIDYEHHRRWGDGNGHSHVRASFVGPSLTVPIVDGSLVLGTWQQIVFMEFDNKPRTREVTVQVVGE